MLLLFLFFYRIFRERINLNGVQPYPKARSENQKAYSYIPDIIPERLKQLHAMKRVGRVNEHIIILSENIGLSYPECRQLGVGDSERAVAEGNAAVFLNER